MHDVVSDLLLFGEEIFQLGQTRCYLLQPFQFFLLLTKLIEFIFTLSVQYDIHIVIVTLLAVDYTYLSEESRCLLRLVSTTTDNTSPSEQSTLRISHFQVVTNYLTVFRQCIFEAGNKWQTFFQIYSIFDQFLQAQISALALFLFDYILSQLFLLLLVLLDSHVLQLPRRDQIRRQQRNILILFSLKDWGVICSRPFKQRNTFILLNLFLVYSLLYIFQYLVKQTIPLLLHCLQLFSETYDLTEMANIGLISHQQQLATFLDLISQIILLRLSDLLEAKDIALVELQNRSRFSLSYLGCMLQSRQSCLLYHIYLESYFAFDNEIEIIIVANGIGLQIRLFFSLFLQLFLIGLRMFNQLRLPSLVDHQLLLKLIHLLASFLLFQFQLSLFSLLINHKLLLDVLLCIKIIHHLEFSQQNLHILLLIIAIQVSYGLLVDLILELHHIALAQTYSSMRINCLLVYNRRMQL